MEKTKILNHKVMSLFFFIFSMIVALPSICYSQGLEINWVLGPTEVILGKNVAKIDLSEDYLFAHGDDTRKIMKELGNPPSNRELGIIIPKETSQGWFIVFDYNKIGYIKDDERDKIDADATLKSIQKATENSNEYRKKKGIPALHIIGWEKEPYYDSLTNNLTWTLLAQEENLEEGSYTINHNIRLLGRHGYMSLVLVTSYDTFNSYKGEIDSIISSFGYLEGKSYAEYVQGDKIAKLGLTALIAGGAATVAAKTGFFKLLAKFGKIIFFAVIAFVAVLWKKIKNIFIKD